MVSIFSYLSLLPFLINCFSSGNLTESKLHMYTLKKTKNRSNSYKNFQTVHYFDSDIIGSTNFIERKNRSQFKRLLSLQDAYKTFSLMYLVSYKSFIAASVLFFPLFLLTSFGEPFNQTLSTLQLSRIHKCKLSTQLKLYEFYVIFSRNE